MFLHSRSVVLKVFFFIHAMSVTGTTKREIGQDRRKLWISNSDAGRTAKGCRLPKAHPAGVKTVTSFVVSLALFQQLLAPDLCLRIVQMFLVFCLVFFF